MVHNLEDVACEGRHSASERLYDVNFAEIAKQCNFTFAQRLRERGELTPTLCTFLSTQGSAFLEIMTDPEEVLYPVVRPGTSYKDMELGPYIKKIE